METFSALLAICAGNSPVSGDFPTQRPVTRNFHVFYDLCLNKRLSKQWWSGDLRHHRANYDVIVMKYGGWWPPGWLILCHVRRCITTVTGPTHIAIGFMTGNDLLHWRGHGTFIPIRKIRKYFSVMVWLVNLLTCNEIWIFLFSMCLWHKEKC